MNEKDPYNLKQIEKNQKLINYALKALNQLQIFENPKLKKELLETIPDLEERLKHLSLLNDTTDKLTQCAVTIHSQNSNNYQNQPQKPYNPKS